VLEWQAEQPAGIPEFKIGGSSDGWLVTPAEIRAALAALEAHPSRGQGRHLRGAAALG
jgi:hypothetical protein